MTISWTDGSLMRLAVMAGTLSILWGLEALAPMFRQKHRMRHDSRNLILGIGNALLMAGLFSGITVGVMQWAQTENFGLLRQIQLPVGAAWIAGLLLFDLWMYCWHVLNHRVPWLWRFHAVHHTDDAMDASSGIRFHTGEILMASCARLMIVLLIGLDPLHLVVYELIARPIVLFHHANIRMPEALDRCLRVFVVTPRMHWVHHSRWQPETDSNYCSGLSIWDRLFGTFRLRLDPSKIELGLEGYSASEVHTLTGMLGTPFRRRERHLGAPPQETV